MGRRSRSRSPSYHSDDDDRDGTRLHIADISPDCSKREIEREFEKFGELYELWLARTPPCFGFAVFKNRVDAYEAMDALNGKVIGNSRLKITVALPRARERTHRRPAYDSNMRCYQCGERGHFARDCERVGRNRSRFSPDMRRRSGGRYREDSRRNSRRSRSRSRNRSRSRDRSRSRSRDRRRDDGSSRRRRRRDDSGSPARRKSSRSQSPDRTSEDRKRQSVGRSNSNNRAKSGGGDDNDFKSGGGADDDDAGRAGVGFKNDDNSP